MMPSGRLAGVYRSVDQYYVFSGRHHRGGARIAVPASCKHAVLVPARHHENGKDSETRYCDLCSRDAKKKQLELAEVMVKEAAAKNARKGSAIKAERDNFMRSKHGGLETILSDLTNTLKALGSRIEALEDRATRPETQETTSATTENQG
jgi:hypothetical protein